MLDFVGVGIGPSNLSLAALKQKLPEIRALFFERQPEFCWHDGLLLPGTQIQVSMFKDLVTLVDPCNPYSFLAFLHAQRRLYRFIHAGFTRVTRSEFNQYLQWVCANVPGLEFGQTVESVRLDHDCFEIRTSRRVVHSRNVILGSGLTPTVPDCAKLHLGEKVFHASEFRAKPNRYGGSHIAVIGGGQTGAEIFASLISDTTRLPEKVYWITRRYNFLPLDESPFTNDLFTPAYSNYFFSLSPETRAKQLAAQALTSNGVAEDTLRTIYQRLYELEFLEREVYRTALMPAQELTGLSTCGCRFQLTLENQNDGSKSALDVDYVILATGERYLKPDYLEPLLSRLTMCGDNFAINDDFTVQWDGPSELRIYLQNLGHCSPRGVADRNLSLIAWRSARILNSLAGRCVFDLHDEGHMVEWGQQCWSASPQGVA